MSPLERFRYIRTLRMPGIAKAVLYSLANHADKDGSCYLLQSTLAEETGFSERSVRTALSFLKKYGLAFSLRHGHHASTFQLTLEAFQKAKKPAPVAGRNRHDVPTEVAPISRTRKRKAKPFPQPRLDPTVPKELRCPQCGAASASLKRGGLCLDHIRALTRKSS